MVIIFVSFCYPLGATFKMLKAVLKKSREGGKGNKKDAGMTINKIFYNVDELCIINPAIKCVLLQQRRPDFGAAGESIADAGTGRSGDHRPPLFWPHCSHAEQV